MGIKRIAGMLVVALGLLGAVACGGKSKMNVKPDWNHSINVVAVPVTWPDEKKDWPKDEQMARLQQKAYEEYGPPDYFRVRWNKNGKLMRQAELESILITEKRKRDRYFRSQELPVDWIYINERRVLKFDRRKGTDEEELRDDLRIVCEYGDPQDIKDTVDINREKNTIFHYFNSGQIFYFKSGELYKEETVTPVPGMNLRR